MDAWRAAEIAIKSFFGSLLLGSFFISFIVGTALGADPLTCIIATVLAIFAGGIVVALVATPVYAGMLCAGIASYYSSALLAAIIAAAFIPFDHEEMPVLFAVYGLPISLFAHFLAIRASKEMHVVGIRPLRG